MKSERKNFDRDLLDSVIMRDVDAVRRLLSQGANVNAEDSEHRETPLTLAVKFADVKLVQLLLDAGAKIDAQDAWGRTALFYAPILSETFKVLLSAKADVHAADAEGNTILMYKVSQSASLDEVDELLRLDVNPNLQNQDGETALDVAESLGLVKVAARLRQAAG